MGLVAGFSASDNQAARVALGHHLLGPRALLVALGDVQVVTADVHLDLVEVRTCEFVYIVCRRRAPRVAAGARGDVDEHDAERRVVRGRVGDERELVDRVVPVDLSDERQHVRSARLHVVARAASEQKHSAAVPWVTTRWREDHLVVDEPGQCSPSC